jgi:hypothetical protein
VLTFASIFLPKQTEASKAKKNDSKFSTMTMPKSNQVRVVAFSLPQLTQASFIQKNQTLQNRFLISNAEMAQSLSSLQKSEF